MDLKGVIDQMTINDEIAVLSDLDTYLSYSSNRPDNHHFVKTDNAFTRKARLLQAIRRWQTHAESGSFTRKGITYYHPNLAKDGQISGCNFLHHEIFEYAKYRTKNKKAYETIGEDRLFNNFLSSQPMAFNLFFPLMEIITCDEGKRRLANVVSSLVDKNDILNIEQITEVGIEFIPDYYNHCLNDRTAMDAFFRYVTKNGKKGIIAIETKYTDILGTNQASDPSLAVKTATEREGISHVFTKEGKERIAAGKIKLSQVYRNLLLTEAVRLYEQLDESLSIIISPQENTSNEKDEKQLSDILNEKYKYKFQVISLESFVEAIIAEFPDEDIFQKFHHRYLDFRTAEWLLKYSPKKF
ncbi:MAG: hypothetical protein IKP36_05950 [Bacteroidaceae bacterium]|nr:hypothetical protein [Bacteroidaceae bacterium]